MRMLLCLFSCIWLCCFTSCKKDKCASPELTTVLVSNISHTTAECGGNIIADGGCEIKARGVCWSVGEEPTSDSRKTIDGSGTGSFTSSIKDLMPGISYTVRSYAINATSTGYGNTLVFETLNDTLIEFPHCGMVTDIDNNTYETVMVGAQCWMKENLKVSRYRSGDLIITGLGNTQWSKASSGSYAVYENDPDNGAEYGYLYNWRAVSDSRGLCPDGWHIPSKSEWETLVDYLGGEEIAGGKMKEARHVHWEYPNTGADNSSGFAALPGGLRMTDGGYHLMGYTAGFWSGTEYDIYNAYIFELNHDQVRIRASLGKTVGFSVRCLKDN